LNIRTPTAHAYNYSPLTAPLRNFIKLVREYTPNNSWLVTRMEYPACSKSCTECSTRTTT
jgi:hypothetical protein